MPTHKLLIFLAYSSFMAAREAWPMSFRFTARVSVEGSPSRMSTYGATISSVRHDTAAMPMADASNAAIVFSYMYAIRLIFRQ